MQFYLDSPVTLSKIPITTKTLQKKIRLKAVLFSFDWSFYQLYSPFVKIEGNGLCKWSAGLKVMNFQTRSEPIVYSYFHVFRQSSKTNWRYCKGELRLNYPLKPALHLHFVGGSTLSCEIKIGCK